MSNWSPLDTNGTIPITTLTYKCLHTPLYRARLAVGRGELCVKLKGCTNVSMMIPPNVPQDTEEHRFICYHWADPVADPLERVHRKLVNLIMLVSDENISSVFWTVKRTDPKLYWYLLIWRRLPLQFERLSPGSSRSNLAL